MAYFFDSSSWLFASIFRWLNLLRQILIFEHLRNTQFTQVSYFAIARLCSIYLLNLSFFFLNYSCRHTLLSIMSSIIIIQATCLCTKHLTWNFLLLFLIFITFFFFLWMSVYSSAWRSHWHSKNIVKFKTRIANCNDFDMNGL